MKATAIAATFILLGSSLSYAVTTNFLQDDLADDFKAGKTENVVISNLGQVSLALEAKTLLEKRKTVSAVFAVAKLSDGSLIAATGPEGLILKYSNGKWKKLFKVDQPYAFSLAVGKSDKIYVGTAGTEGHIYELTPDGQSKVIFRDSSVNYIWALRLLKGGKLLAATGSKGKVFQIDKSGAKCIFTYKQKNIISMAPGAEGKIYLGTDTAGVLYVLEPGRKDGEYASRAIYDANEDQICAITVADDGAVYFATASGKAAPGQARAFLKKPAGRPETKPATQPATQPATVPATTQATTQATKPATTQATKPALVGPETMKMLGARRPPTGGTSKGVTPSRDVPGKTNAIYHLDRLGFVSEIFRDKLDICALVWHKGKLYAGTWPDGWMLEINPDTEEIRTAAKADAKFIYSINIDQQGRIIYTAGSPGRIVQLGPDLAKTGTFTSKVHGADQIARWGRLLADFTKPKDAKADAKIQTRISSVKDKEDPAWSDWTAAKSLAKSQLITSPSARFIQYKLTLTSEGRQSTVVDKIRLAYMQDNQAPQFQSLQVQLPNQTGSSSEARPPKTPKPKTFKVSWKASDPNSDKLIYNVYLRLADQQYWIELEKDYKKTTYQWDPISVPDGEYQFKVVASDRPSNPADMYLTTARLSDPFIVDNTPPQVRNLKAVPPEKVRAARAELVLTANLVDNLSEIAGAWIRVNGQKDWQYIAPADEIYDSKEEYIETILARPSAGPVLITLKVKDRAGNIGYGKLIVPPQKNID